MHLLDAIFVQLNIWCITDTSASFTASDEIIASISILVLVSNITNGVDTVIILPLLKLVQWINGTQMLTVLQ